MFGPFKIRIQSMQSLVEGTILALLALVIYLFTVNDQTRAYALPVLVLALAIVGVMYLYSLHTSSKHPDLHQQKTFQILIFACTSAILLWVGTTGWFVSPFFYLLYLVAISLAFLFNSSAAFSFVLVLVAVLLPQIGGINMSMNIFSLISLLLIIPLSYFLRREYIGRIEKEKKILVLEKAHTQSESEVDKILANKVTNLGALLREPINDIRQIALYAQKQGQDQEKANLDKIVILTSRAFDLLKEFEEESTGRKLMRTPKKTN